MARDGTEEQADSPLHGDLKEALENIIAPLLARDGASVELVSMTDGVVMLRGKGSLRGCPGRVWTEREVILPALRLADPQVTEVRIT
ncbi:MAG: NifU family protein [Polyangiales bacterium]